MESSKKRLTTVRPRRAGSFLTGRPCTSDISSARSKISGDLSSIKISSGQQVAHQISPRTGSLPCSMLTWSIPSISASLTLTCSPVRVGMYFPT
mgnify:CR=1 FL=1